MMASITKDKLGGGTMDPKSETIKEDLLVPLRPMQCTKLRYPPTCPVVHTDSSQQQATYGVIDKAFIHFDTREIVYKLKETTGFGERNGNVIVPESELQFGRGAPVWASPPNGSVPVPAIILGAYVPPKDFNHDVLYSVQTVEDGWVLHYCSLVEFRGAPDEPAKPLGSCPVPQIPFDDNSSFVDGTSSSPLSLATPEDSCNQEDDTLLQCRPQAPTTPPPEHHSDAAAISDQEDTNSSESSPEATSATSVGNDCLAGEDFSKSQRMSDASSSIITEPESKRQKREDPIPNVTVIGRHILVLPMWMDAQAAKRCFDSNKGRLETETNCNLELRGGAVEACPTKPYKLFVEIECHDEDSILPAIRSLEDLFRGIVGGRGSKALFMYDIARSNPDYYEHKGDYVYQRFDCGKNILHFRWVEFIEFPRELSCFVGMRYVLGDDGRALMTKAQQEGKTACRLMVAKRPRKGVLLSGKGPKEIIDCTRRFWDRVAWARKRMQNR